MLDADFKLLDHQVGSHQIGSRGQEVGPGYKPDVTIIDGHGHLQFILECEHKCDRKAFIGDLIKAEMHAEQTSSRPGLVIVMQPAVNTTVRQIASHLKTYADWLAQNKRGGLELSIVQVLSDEDYRASVVAGELLGSEAFGRRGLIVYSRTENPNPQEARADTDCTRYTFIERVSLAAREPVYSAALAWLFEDHSPLPLARRLAILSGFCGVMVQDGISIDASTEWNEVDLLLTVRRRNNERTYIAIENKIKSVEGNEQLERYDAALSGLGPVCKILLTLSGEAPRGGEGWQGRSYAQLLAAIESQGGTNDCYVADLRNAFARLVKLADATQASGSMLVRAAFDGEGAADTDPMIAYMKRMRLEGVVQRIWTQKLAYALDISEPWHITTGETRGQALLDITAALDGQVKVGLQIQRAVLKAFCAPYSSELHATPDQVRNVEVRLQEIRAAFRIDPRQNPSTSRSRGFRSFRIESLPPGRDIQTWVAQIRPRFQTIASAFPKAMSIP